MSVPAVAEQVGWQSRRINRLPARATVFAGLVAAAAAAAIVAAAAWNAPVDRDDWTAFAILLPLAAVSPLFRVSVGRNHGFHVAPVFVVAGALVLPPLLVVALVLGFQPTHISVGRLASQV